MVCHFPEAVQDEVFATPDVRLCGTLSPSTMAAPVDGGVVANGKWGFISGVSRAPGVHFGRHEDRRGQLCGLEPNTLYI